MSLDRFELRSRRYEVEHTQRWQDEVARLPWIQFPADWKVKVIPPFGDAVVRFLVTLPDGKEKSVYHDSRASLGMHFGDGDELIPYWEVYPVNGDIGRCGTDEVELLLEMIAEGSEEKEEADVNGWVTDRRPMQDNDGAQVYGPDGNVCHWTYIKIGDPWKPIPKCEPYVKPKRWRLVHPFVEGYWKLKDADGNEVHLNFLGINEIHEDAAKEIAMIYERVKP